MRNTLVIRNFFTTLTGILISLIFSAGILAQELDESWSLKLDEDGIQVFTNKIDDSPYDAVISQTIVSQSSLSAMVALIRDAEACADWADRCAESYVFEKISETEELVYTHNDLPFPVKDRDVLARVNWQQDPQNFVVRMDSEAVAGFIPEQRSRLRLLEARAFWEFAPLERNRIRVTNFAHINPGSNLPAWVTNMLLVDTPFQTMKAFVAEIRNPKYSSTKVSFVVEP